MSFDITSDITFRKLSIFMTFMEKGNIARTAEALGLSGVSVHRALHTLEENVRCRSLRTKVAISLRCLRPGRCWNIVRK